MAWKVLVPSIFLPFLSDPTPNPWHSLPILLENEVFQLLAKVGWFRKCWYLSIWPVASSNTVMAHRARRAWRYMLLAHFLGETMLVARVCEQVCCATGASRCGLIDASSVALVYGVDLCACVQITIGCSCTPLELETRTLVV